MSTGNESALSQPLRLNESIKQSIEPIPSAKKPQSSERNSINPVIEEEEVLLSNHELSHYGKTIKCYRKVQVASIVCIIIALLMVFAAPPLLQSKIKDLSIDQVILKPQNEGLWAHFPGDSAVDIIRNYTFFQLTNQQNYYLHHEKPVFREISGYKIKQLEDFLNITYLNDGNQVQFIDWLRFELRSDSRNLSQLVSILNMGSLGYWYTLKNSRPTLLLQQGLAILFTTIQSSIKSTLMGQGIFSQFVKDIKTFSSTYCFPAGISEVNCEFLWSDMNYGFGDQNRLSIWVNATEQFYKNGSSEVSPNQDAFYLRNYFVLTQFQIGFLLQKIKSNIDSLTQILLQNHYCQDLPSLQDCTGRYLAVRQMATSFVTFDTPPVSTVNQTDTICENNMTCSPYFPEIGAYYKRVYKILHPAEPQIDPFAWQTVLKWLDYNTSSTGGKWNTDESCLLHIGNLDALWTSGTLYDKTKDETLLQTIMERFKLTDIAHTKVFWEWLKYITSTFVLQKKQNQHVGLSTLFATGIYNGFTPLQDNLQPFLLSKLITKQLTTVSCQKLFEDSMGVDGTTSTSICNQYIKTYGKDPFAREMINVCERTGDKAWTKLKQSGPSLMQIQQFCDPQGKSTSFGAILHNNKVYLNNFYNCTTTPVEYCSDFELAALQWSSSGVTTNVLPELSDQLKTTTTFKDWMAVPAVEYSHFVSKFNQTEKDKFPKFNITKSYSLLNFDNWFSSTVVLKQIAAATPQDKVLDYMRYISIFVTLNGSHTTRTPYEYMFGYEDEFLAKIKNDPPPFGGDPSAPSIVAFNDPNITDKEASLKIVFQTGKDDYQKLGQYYTINGYRYLTNEYASFNGNTTVTEVRTPWAENDYFYGTNAKLFAPDQPQSNNISLYIPNLQRYGSGPFTDAFPYERYGMDLYIAYIGEELYENTSTSDRNKKYYQTFEAIFNETSVVGIPIFTSKNHFMNSTDNWLKAVDIWDENMTKKYTETGHEDDTYCILEPYTGVSFQSTIYLQNNYYHEPDILFTYPYPTMLPIFTIYRSGALSEDKANEIYGPLLLALSAKIVIKYIGISMLVILIVVLAFLTYRVQRMKRQIEKHKEAKGSVGKSSAVGISLQEQSNPQGEREGQRQPVVQVQITQDS